jgi:hypothetical protein
MGWDSFFDLLTDQFEEAPEGNWQLEFLYWGDWSPNDPALA